MARFIVERKPPKMADRGCTRCKGRGRVERVNPSWIRWHRERARLGLTAWAHKLGLSVGFVADLESGRRDASLRVLALYEGLD